jgi:hypothetical protein
MMKRISSEPSSESASRGAVRLAFFRMRLRRIGGQTGKQAGVREPIFGQAGMPDPAGTDPHEERRR